MGTVVPFKPRESGKPPKEPSPDSEWIFKVRLWSLVLASLVAIFHWFGLHLAAIAFAIGLGALIHVIFVQMLRSTDAQEDADESDDDSDDPPSAA